MNLLKVLISDPAIQTGKAIILLARNWQINFLPKRFASRGLNSLIQLPHYILGAQYIHIGSRVSIGARSYIHAIDHYMGESYNPNISIGDDVYIGRDCYINAISTIEIQEGCVLSEGVYLADEGHGLDPEAGLIMKQRLTTKGPILIGAHSFIGLRACVLPGVVLGHHCVVGTGAVVTRSFPPYSMLVGNPAKIIKRYDPVCKTWENIDHDSKG
jgi:acetyltransferase-like isoleucine patch superfamily enzyme